MLAAKPQKRAKLRYSEYYDQQVVTDRLYAQSKAGTCFTNLLPLIASEENIRLAYRCIKRNTGSNTSGMDHMTIQEIEAIESLNYTETIQRMLSWYTPRTVRRKEIRKPNGKMRPLGIPSIWDRLFQQCILQVLEPICEAKFYERSNGFRPNRSTENAVAQCYHMIQARNLHFVVDVDIEGFFDNVNHAKLIQQLWTLGIRDKNLLCIIRKMLRAPIALPDGSMEHPTKGTPQGGILSPLLSNIVLNELDWWVASNWEDLPMHSPPTPQYHKNGARHRSNDFRALRQSNLKEMYIVRYADDFKIFCRTRSDADKTFIAVKQWLEDRLKLQINIEKSKVTNLKKCYTEFLGFMIRAKRKRKKHVAQSHVCDSAVERIKEQLKAQVRKISRPESNQSEHLAINRYNAMVMGQHNYYRIATDVSNDFSNIAYEIKAVLKNGLKKRLKRTGEIYNKAIRERYGDSKQMRFVNHQPIVPVGYIRTKPPMWKKASVNAYTPEGRAEIHKNLGIDTTILHMLMRAKEFNRSVEYMDNRLSLYCAQYGKCAVTGRYLEYDEIHCHHKIPRYQGGSDRYNNLIIVHTDIHRLIHAKTQSNIDECLQLWPFDSKTMEKLNKLRIAVGREPIAMT